MLGVGERLEILNPRSWEDGLGAESQDSAEWLCLACMWGWRVMRMALPALEK